MAKTPQASQPSCEFVVVRAKEGANSSHENELVTYIGKRTRLYPIAMALAGVSASAMAMPGQAAAFWRAWGPLADYHEYVFSRVMDMDMSLIAAPNTAVVVSDALFSSMVTSALAFVLFCIFVGPYLWLRVVALFYAGDLSLGQQDQPGAKVVTWNPIRETKMSLILIGCVLAGIVDLSVVGLIPHSVLELALTSLLWRLFLGFFVFGLTVTMLSALARLWIVGAVNRLLARDDPRGRA